MSEGAFNPAARRLCPDGSCIGVIGADGRCRVCGRAGDGAAVAETAGGAFADDPRNQDSHEDRYADADADADERSADGEPDGSAVGGGAFRPDRRLCEDGSCVGVIGAGDVCSVCGRPAGS